MEQHSSVGAGAELGQNRKDDYLSSLRIFKRSKSALEIIHNRYGLKWMVDIYMLRRVEEQRP